MKRVVLLYLFLIFVLAGFSQSINVSMSTLDFEDVYQGFNSRVQTYTVSASLLSSDLVISSPSGFEISSDCSTFGSSISLIPNSGNVSSTTIYVRFSPATSGSFSGSISHSSSGAATKSISVNETTATSNLPSGYYSSASGTGSSLKTSLHNIIDNHTSRTYSQLWTDFSSTDRLPNGDMWDMYSDISGCTSPSYTYTYSTDQCGTYGTEGDCYNREHSFPKSWFNDASPMYTDLFHIVASDGYVNGIRGNYPFGEVGTANYTSHNGSKRGNNTYGSYTGTVFEPIDEYKGDFARIYFYMATRYEDLIDDWDVNSAEADAVLNGTTFPCYESWFLNMIIDWHNTDPVSQKELSRNDEIYSIQGNRNPFIDNPSYVNDIWGTPAVDPEPSNYPTIFSASENGNDQIDLNWTDATGAELPDAYLIKINTSGTFSTPVDDTEPAEDTDFSDGSGLVKINYGVESYSFTNLSASTQYYFKIWSYTNSGSDIDFKTNGTPPTAYATTTAASAGGGLSDLIISEYVEGSSNNKYLEIYNGTAADVNLSNYSIRIYANGNTSPNSSISLSSVLSDGSTYVIENNQATIYSGTADLTSGSLGFNGNDAIALFDGSSNIDVIGTIGSSTTFAENKTLIRNNDICSPNSTYSSSEWTEYSQDNVSDLGSHTANCGSSAPDAPASFSALTSSDSQIDLSWTQNGNSDNVMIVYNTSGTFTDPVDGTSYSISSSACGGTVIYNQSGTSFNHTSLSSGTQYFYKAWSVDGSDNYSMGVTDDATTLKAEPGNHVTSFSAVEDGLDEIIIGWTDATGTTTPDGYVVKANTSGSFTAPSDGTDPTEDADLSDGAALVKIAQGNEIHSFTGLSGSTTYYFKIWPYTNSGNDIDFKTNGTVPTASATTDAAPSTVPPSVGDVYISEVSDASNYNNEFIELYNVTNNIIDLSDCKLVMNLSTDFQISAYTGDIQIPANGFIVIARGATLAGFESEWGALPANTNFNEGSGDMFFGSGTARRWQLVYNDGSKADIIIDDTDVAVGGSGNTTTQDGADNWSTQSSGSNSTPGSFPGSNPFPIHLLSFSGSGQDGYNLLQWATASEENNDYFTLEKSTDGEAFKLVAIIAGAGNSNEILNYQAKDFNVDADLTYYRLKQTDYDGAYTYSDIISVQSGEAAELILNIAQQDQKLLLKLQNLQQGPVTVELYDIHGRKILSNKYQNTDSFMNIKLNTAVEQGIYLLRVMHNQQIINEKISF